MSQARAGVFSQLDIGLARRRLYIVAPASDPVPLPGGIPVVEPYLQDRSSSADFLEPSEYAALAILARLDFDDHGVVPLRSAPSDQPYAISSRCFSSVPFRGKFPGRLLKNRIRPSW